MGGHVSDFLLYFIAISHIKETTHLSVGVVITKSGYFFFLRWLRAISNKILFKPGSLLSVTLFGVCLW